MTAEALAGDRTLLEAGGRAYAWPQVLAAAYFRGDAQSLHRDTADALAVAAYAAEQGFAAPAAAGETGDAFRLEHELITGEEMDRWLERVDIPLERFDAHFASRALLERFRDRLDEIRRDYAPEQPEVVAAMWDAALLTGAFEAFARDFAHQVAARLAAAGAVDAAAAARLAAEGGPQVPACLSTAALVDELAALEAARADAEAALASTGRLSEELRAQSWQLTRLVVAECLFVSLDQAREARLAVAADGSSLAEVAAGAGAQTLERTLFVDEVPEPARSLLFSAAPGAVLAPEPLDEGGALLRALRRRIEPDLADPDVAARLRRRLVASHFDALVARHVTWRFDPWSTS